LFLLQYFPGEEIHTEGKFVKVQQKIFAFLGKRGRRLGGVLEKSNFSVKFDGKNNGIYMAT